MVRSWVVVAVAEQRLRRDFVLVDRMRLLVGQMAMLFVRAGRSQLWTVDQILLERVAVVVVDLFAQMETESARMVDQNRHLVVDSGPIAGQKAMQW